MEGSYNTKFEPEYLLEDENNNMEGEKNIYEGK